MSKNIQIPFLILIFGCALVVWIKILQADKAENKQGNWQPHQNLFKQEKITAHVLI